MRPSFSVFTLVISGIQAAYLGDIVQYWADQGGVLINSTTIGGLQSPPSAWGPAIVHAAVYLAATETEGEALEYQQLAVSHAAHNTLVWLFHGTRNYGATNAALRRVLPLIGHVAADAAAVAAGRNASERVVTARASDGINDFVNYVYGERAPGVYQNYSVGQFPDTPQARFVRLFAGVGDVAQFTLAGPPDPSSPEYEEFLETVRTQGARDSTVRTPFDTETAYYWLESSISHWTRFTNAAIGQSLATDVQASARLYSQLYYALANAGFASWHAKYGFNAWRPITAIRYPGVYLASGRNVSNATWTPLLNTPSHQDYTSTHATFGAAAAQVIRSYLGTDEVNVTVSSNVTADGVGVVTRTYTSLAEANRENGASRVFGGIHFQFASDDGDKLGTDVALATLEHFDEHWDEF